MSHQTPDDPFEHLKSVDAPDVRSTARQRAIEAGLAAFAAEQEKKKQVLAKGPVVEGRLKSIIASLRRISIMDARIPIGTVALALLLLPLGWQLYNSTSMTPAGVAGRTVTTEQPPAPVPEADMAIADADQTPSVVEEAPIAEPAPEMAMDSEMAAPAPMPSGAAVQRLDGIAPNMAVAKTRSMGGSVSTAAEPSGDSFTRFDEQRLKVAAEDPVSTFSIDVDTTSYSYVRRMLEDGLLPPPEAVRVEELINYFPYDYPPAPSADVPFQPEVKVYPTPWNAKTQIMQIGIKGYAPPATAHVPSNLVFLIDTSGSMDEPDKLPLLKRAFGLLLDQLTAEDTVSIVTYAGSAGVALEPTPADRKATIMAALDDLSAGGSTAGAQGIDLAYRLADQARIDGGTNRVILATDGDFNVGIDDPDALKDFIAAKRQSGIGLSVLGFGRGNLDDATMQALAQNGDGNASYISSFAEARKVLVEELGGTLNTIARDVKIQVEFNPDVVSEYRLIGYETRALNREDFNNDAVDAGDVGAGTTVTALYEITPAGSDAELVDPLRYGETGNARADGSDEIAFLKMRYKLPEDATSQLIETPVRPDVVYGDIADAGADAEFAAAVAAFGQKLRGSAHGAAMNWGEIERLAQAGRGTDAGGYRAEFVRLLGMAKLLKPDAR